MMLVVTAVSSISLQVWSLVFHWQPQELVTHDMHLKTRAEINAHKHQRYEHAFCKNIISRPTHKQNLKTCKLIKECPAQKSMLLTTKWISATSHRQSSFITHPLAWKKWRKKEGGKEMARSTFIFWLMKRKLRQFPRLGNKKEGRKCKRCIPNYHASQFTNRALISHLFMHGDTFTSTLSADAAFSVTVYFQWVTEQNW